MKKNIFKIGLVMITIQAPMVLLQEAIKSESFDNFKAFSAYFIASLNSPFKRKRTACDRQLLFIFKLQCFFFC